MIKVFLMFRDQDFILDEEALPANKEDLERDLEIGTLFRAMAGDDVFLYQVARQAVLSSLREPEKILYRQQVLRDCLSHPEVIRQIYQIPLTFLERKRSQWLWISTRHANPSSILSSGLHMLEASLDLIRELREIADREGEKFASEGFRRLFSMFQTELDDNYLSLVQETIKRLRFPNGALLRAQLGPGNEGRQYLLCKPNHARKHWISRVFTKKSPEYSFTLHPRDENGSRALAELRNLGIARAADAVARAADQMESFFNILRLELAFYIGCMHLRERLNTLSEPTVFPDPVPNHRRELTCRELYDITLALTMGKKVVANDIHAAEKDLHIITGPNQGGKTTFLRSLGVAQLMMQCGMFVSAKAFSASLCSGLFTHFKREEDKTMKSGKFEEELKRIGRIINLVRSGALLLLNESFGATNEREGSEVARQIITALMEKGIRIFFVTHLYECAHGFYQRELENVLFLRAERLKDQKRTFKIREGKPLPTSFGLDLYRKVFKRDLQGVSPPVAFSPASGK